jgi:mannose-6-phosphate isomerase-like protein (cupin superfamily)
MTSTLQLDRHTVLHLASDLSISRVAVSEDYWQHRADAPELADGRLLSIFDYDTTWTWWERHPVGEELVLVLSGQVVFQLDDARGAREVALQQGESTLVPEGAWHRAVVVDPVRLLFVTPTPARTELRQA